MQDASVVRTAVFFGGLALLLALEWRWPRAAEPLQRRLRWPANFGLAAVDAVLLALLPLATVGVAAWARVHGWGLLPMLGLPGWIETPLAWLILDLAIYWQHRWLHEWRWAWPMHRVHHSDVALDASTGVRFHPAEIVLSLAWKSAVIVALGAGPLAALAMELALNLFALWSHASVQLSPALERALRRLVITPDWHRIHHSVVRAEADSNYGGSLSVWDRLFGSYTPAPRAPLDAMPVGLQEHRSAAEQKLPALLIQPLR
ncbi:MAG TPA: sterol desaturase family protein [Solimonas sp.]|nr:sterol desaturase family protein [Solimonas sp.]